MEKGFRVIPLSAHVALRYLFGKKSHSAVNAIALVSLVGIAVATAAIVCVLSVFNGFKEVLGGKLDTFTPDIEVCSRDSRVFEQSDLLVDKLKSHKEIKSVTPVLTEQALALAGTRELPIMLRGVEAERYNRATRIDTLFYEGSEPLVSPHSSAQAAPASLAIGTAVQLQAGLIGTRVTIFAPRRTGRINLANPAASFLTDSIEVTSIYRSGQKEYDENVVICDIGRVRELLQHSATSANSIEVRLAPGVSLQKGKEIVSRAVGSKFRVRDRDEQHETSFRMVRIEKYVTFLLLVFILVIASFNVISTLCMLVIEKEESIRTLGALGMSRRKIGDIFGWESWLVTLSGGIGGIILGSLLCLLQQHFGFIKLNGDADTLITAVYPVRLEVMDLLLTLVPVIVIGGLCALTASRYARVSAARCNYA